MNRRRLDTTGGSFVSFTTSNWDTAQSITLTAPADSDIVDETVTVTLTGTSSDSDYSGELSTFTVTVTDAGAPAATQQMWFWDNNGDINDGNGHQVAPADGAGRLTELEMTAGTTVPVWITLSENPGATVTVALAENETLLGINKSGLGTYRVSDNWNARGGGHGFNVILGPAAASGATFSVTATASSSDDDWDDVVTTLTVIAA